MTYAPFELRFTDAQGNLLAGTDVFVQARDYELAGQPPAPVFADAAGNETLAWNHKVTTGKLRAFAPGKVYLIRTWTGADEQNPESEDSFVVPVGRGGASDIVNIVPRGDWADDPASYDTGHLVHHGGLAFVSNIDDNVGNEPPATAVSDANWTHVPALQGAPGSSHVVGTSATSLTPTLSAHTFTVDQLSRGWGVGARLRASSDANPAADWAEGTLGSYGGDQAEITFDLLSPFLGAGPFADWTIQLAGERGPAGADGTDPGHLLTWETATADENPAAGGIRADNANLSAATQLFISKTSRAGSDISAFLDGLDDSGNTAGKGTLQLTTSASGKEASFRNGAVTDATGYVKVAVSGHSGETAFTAAAAISLQHSRDGEPGGGLGSVVEDTTPQLGGMLDVNGQAIGDGTRELVTFVEDPAAVNQVELENEETGSGPIVRAAGDDADIDLNLEPKGTGAVKTGGQAVLTAATGQAINSGQAVTEHLGTVATGTITPEPSGGATKDLTNGGAFTWAAPTEEGGYICEVLNNGSAGAITASGFDAEESGSFTTTDTHRFEVAVTNIGGFKEMTVRARQ